MNLKLVSASIYDFFEPKHIYIYIYMINKCVIHVYTLKFFLILSWLEKTCPEAEFFIFRFLLEEFESPNSITSHIQLRYLFCENPASRSHMILGTVKLTL